MEHTFEIHFDAEYPDISSFELLVQESLKLYQLDGNHTVECIIEQAYKRCKTTEIREPVAEVQLALLKTVCLEIIQELSQARRNRQKFDQAVKALFDEKNPDALSFCASVTRTLHQFRLSGTYEAREVIAEAYTRGVKQITSGTLIEVPLAWLRGTCLRVISELKRKQLKSENPKLDPKNYVVEDTALSEMVLQEDIRAIQFAVKHLSAEDHHLLCVRIFEGLTWQEIGELISQPGDLPLSPGTARQRGSRALKRLRQHYEAIREDIQTSDNEDS